MTDRYPDDEIEMEEDNSCTDNEEILIEPQADATVVARKRLFAALAIGGALSILGVAYVSGDSVPSYKPSVVKNAKAKKTELSSGESALVKKYGGQVFSMKRLPGMPENNNKVKGNVYLRIPKNADSDRLLIYLHGNGDQTFKDDASSGNIVECAKKLQLPILAPQDAWAGTKGSDKLPSNWKGLEDPEVLLALVRFAESQAGETADEIILGSFSGGNIGVTKILRSLQESEDSEAKDLYQRIRRIAFFDSASGVEADYVARWMDGNSDAELFSCYNQNAGGLKGRWHNGDLTYKAGNDLLRAALKNEDISSSRFQIDEIPKKKSAGHGVRSDKCKEYLE